MVKVNVGRNYFIGTFLLLCGIILTSLEQNASGQSNLTVTSQEKDKSGNEKSESLHSVYSGLGFGNNMIYLGSNVSQDKPFLYTSVAYGYKNEFFASVSVNHLTAYDPLLSFTSFTLNYNRDLNSWFDISVGLSRYQVNKELSESLFSSFFYGYLNLGFDWKILYTQLNAGGVFSEGSGAFFSLRNSRYIKTSDLAGGKAYFYFDPYFNLLFGNLTRTTTADGTSTGVTPPFKPGGGSSSGGSGSGSGVTTSTFFSLMELDLGLPAGFTFGKLTLEAEPGYIIPTFSDTGITDPKGFTLFFNIFYKIF
ncbi:MAG: hypothetical protein GT600_11750 [Bacteroidales bacterium]|mgnify:FL=1|jgi:hypothetical protein|nr:hypothetical protein [Bacteroidales bacterium]OQB60505.1 MAG: hypothetical protein BWX96_02153 [Bacteroidetes bacterium ADurb.Bin145]HNU16044.1 hypothetical protein [Chitinophagaceae bacterium]HOU03020.1 hypothetical protein [Bacteroidales bacterium]HQK69094.1 hypothetical protein [Bacteroidales bacterium]